MTFLLPDKINILLLLQNAAQLDLFYSFLTLANI